MNGFIRKSCCSFDLFFFFFFLEFLKETWIDLLRRVAVDDVFLTSTYNLIL